MLAMPFCDRIGRDVRMRSIGTQNSIRIDTGLSGLPRVVMKRVRRVHRSRLPCDCCGLDGLDPLRAESIISEHNYLEAWY